MPDTPDNFAQRLRCLRELSGCSQADLAKRTGLQPSAISHFETGTREPSLANLRKLTHALGCSADLLIGTERGAWTPQVAPMHHYDQHAEAAPDA